MPASIPSNPDRATIVDALHESYRGPAWHGPSVVEALAGVDARAAAYKLDSDRNSIHELVLHLAHGRHLVIERITGAPIEPFPRSLREPWWPVPNAEPTDEDWRRDLALLDQYHQRLLDTIHSATDAQLARVPGESGGYSVARQLVGMALHDTYHAGQIRLLALLWKP
ncbi:MAG TPA: DinB family protein [Gemmatimonadaceae bacterium]|nr:DinB family protein [Gemmatimonadaceae bacterium]